ncbi:Modification methylase BanI [compost metagenome]
MDPNAIAPALVATDVSKLAVPDGVGLRRLTKREGLRLFGYPEWYEIPVKDDLAFDLLGNTVAVPVVEFVASRVGAGFKKTRPKKVKSKKEQELTA